MLRRNFLCIIFLAITTFCFAQGRFFTELKKKDNSSFSGLITSIYRDSDGFLWIGAPSALLRYDGNSYVEFTNNKNDKNSLSQSDIEFIFEDSHKRLWFCSRNGLNLYNKENLTFTRYYPFKENSGFSNRIKAICQLNDSIYFLASYGGGVCKFNYNTKKFTFYVHSNLPNSLPSNIVNTVYIDSKKQLWVGTESGGLSCLNPKTGTFTNYLPQLNNPHTLQDKTVSSIIEDANGNLWIGTWRGGLHKFNTKTKKFTNYAHLFESKTIRSIVKGEKNDIWITTFKGIINFNTKNETYTLYTHNPYNSQSIHYDVNWSICYDQEKILWIGSMGRGISYSLEKYQAFSTPDNWDLQYKDAYINGIQKVGNSYWFGTQNKGVFIWDVISKKITDFKHNKALTGQTVGALLKDSKNNMWIGTNMGLYFYNLHSNNSQLHSLAEAKGFNIYSIIEDKNGGYYIGGWNTGLLYINSLQSRKATVFKSNKQTNLPSNIIWKLFIDSKKRIWVLTSEGVGLWDNIKNKFTQYLTDPNVFAINEDENHTIWCGSSQSQVFRFNEKTKTFNLFHEFTDNTYHIASIYFSKPFIWIATQNGLIRLDQNTKQTRRFKIDDGLTSNYFTWASEKLPDGKIIIGTANGPLILDQKYIDFYTFKPNLAITSVRVLDQPKTLINNSITLQHYENKITIGFSALSLSAKEVFNYTYQLQGFDSKKINTLEKNVVYTNLDPGTYTFTLSYSTANNLTPDKPTEFTIIVLAPWWETWWFRLLIICSISFIFYYRFRAIKLRNKELKSLVENKTKELLESNKELHISNQTLNDKAIELEILNETKTKLFSIIGHDLNNPISAIIQLSEILYDSFDEFNTEKKKQIVSHINASSQNVFQLLKNLLDWSRSQQNFLNSTLEPTQVLNCITEVMSLYKHALQIKQIEIHLNIESSIYVLADYNMLQTCFRNIISNAIKYSNPHSKIYISVTETKNNIISMHFKDSGIGMSKEQISKIFSINKSSQVGTSNEKGTGLGLLIVKEFIEMMHGSIQIVSEQNLGSKVSIELPASTNKLKDTKNLGASHKTLISKDDELEISNEIISTLKDKKLLIIDDDEHLRISLQTILEQYFIVLSTENAKSGLEKITEFEPDIIICDVEMPEMSGFELCKIVKNSITSSHIPFLLLTALDSNQDTIIGLQAGADDYITKPCNKTVLLLKIITILKNRIHLQNELKNQEKFYIKPGTISSLDEKLLEKIIKTIHENIKDSNFGVEELSKLIGLSRSQLHRKMTSLVSMSTSEFINIIRLKLATELLQTGKLTIAEVAYDCGFNDPRYFSKCFKELYGCIPSEYLKK